MNALLDRLSFINTGTVSLVCACAILGCAIALILLDQFSSGSVREFIFGSPVSPSAAEEAHPILGDAVVGGELCVSRGGGEASRTPAACRKYAEIASAAYPASTASTRGRHSLPDFDSEDLLLAIEDYNPKYAAVIRERRRVLAGCATATRPNVQTVVFLQDWRAR